MTAKIALTNVHKSFGPKDVLRGVNLEVETGQSLVVIGGSGSGKSVMLKSILGLLTPDSGSIKIDSRETVGLARRGRAVAVAQVPLTYKPTLGKPRPAGHAFITLAWEKHAKLKTVDEVGTRP